MESFEIWCWRRTGRVRTEEVLQREKEERNVLLTVKRRKANWIGHILHRDSLLKHFIEGKTRKNRSERKTRKRT
jgi:hypothetical protein